MFCHSSWVKGVTGHLLSHKNGPVGQLMVEEKVKVRMVLTVNDLVLTLEDEVRRQEAYVGINVVRRIGVTGWKKECDEMTVN